MTLAEQRGALIAAMKAGLRDKIHIISGCCATDDEIIKDQLAAVSAAGLSIIGTEVTEKMRLEGYREYGDVEKIFKAMVAAGDLARKPQ